MRDGYGATTMEAIAAGAGVAKRTLYARFAGKPAIFQAVVAALIAAWRPPFDAAVAEPLPLAEALHRAGTLMLRTALAPEALALYRLIVAESTRFPEIARSVAAAGAATGIERIGALLGDAGIARPYWAAEQFQRLVIDGPQARALGLGPALTTAECAAWVAESVGLFLSGVAVG